MAETAASNSKESWPSTITAVDNPLKFFALCLLIVEALIAILAIKSTDMFTLSLIGTSLFVFVVVMVVFIMIRYPTPLTAEPPNELINQFNKVEQKTKELIEIGKLHEKAISDLDLIEIVPEAQPNITQANPSKSNGDDV